ncbi:hypothetical protein [Limosilactobacillus reuteri]|nr:hypothetical protein [Limosilactobacillus reuteri]
MLESGVTPSTLDKENYLEILRVLKAKSREERPMNPEDAHKKLARLMGN